MTVGKGRKCLCRFYYTEGKRMGISDSDRKRLISAALEARAKSYSPYSRFSVGAALMGTNGEIFIGANIENASYSLTVCAERVAYFAAVSAGVTEFAAIALAGGVGDAPDDYCTPCGA